LKPEQKGKYNIAYLHKDASPELREQKLRDFYIERMRIITVHECLPGHHLQFSYAQTIKRSEIQQKLGHSTVYVEGWGLYSEQVMGELGFYKGLKGKLAVLKMRLWRAARVIIDVSRHFFSMTEKEAVDLLKKKILLEEIGAIAEAKRYYNSPTQPLSYLYGLREINALRQRMREKCKIEGKSFSLLNFHKAILDYPFIQPYLLWGAIAGDYKLPTLDFKKIFSQ